ncbi:DUF305 domain-containing protein [Pseudarthrobacter sulfonivorans]|uniref:DUF305 domain-containing protein n=1 Tax=Pseudarthrobacter sulfonivorans TaxID=121292 RepID=UPI00168BBFD1|nr:DUF305 domain-containing protein [Pseudarthrobacter sulfonivorans]
MNTKLRSISIAAALAASLGLAGCAAGSAPAGGNAMSGMHGTAGPTASMMPDANADHNQADIMFAQMMVPHHTQAVEMSDIILAKQGIPAEVTTLAGQIKAAQAPEIKTMQGWLETWNQPAGIMGATTMPGHGMGGMVDAGGIDRLKAAQGTDAVRLFLEQMIGHHEGAIDMAQQEIRTGKYPATIELCRDIVTSQQAEIIEMQALLGTL